MSTQYKHKLKKLIDLLSIKKSAIKGEDTMERDTKQKDEEDKNEDKIEHKFMRFISKMIDCLGRLEKTIFDLKFEYLIHQPDTILLFDHHEVTKELSPKL